MGLDASTNNRSSEVYQLQCEQDTAALVSYTLSYRILRRVFPHTICAQIRYAWPWCEGTSFWIVCALLSYLSSAPVSPSTPMRAEPGDTTPRRLGAPNHHAYLRQKGSRSKGKKITISWILLHHPPATHCSLAHSPRYSVYREGNRLNLSLWNLRDFFFERKHVFRL